MTNLGLDLDMINFLASYHFMVQLCRDLQEEFFETRGQTSVRRRLLGPGKFESDFNVD